VVVQIVQMLLPFFIEQIFIRKLPAALADQIVGLVSGGFEISAGKY
jgi:hypothetical protein